jgi:NAD(P)-dependent dehydrogenase (short-subunit alcohol dehydrogenase family)
MRSFAGLRVLITGAASGIGRALALELCRRGALLGLTDVDRAGLALVAELVKSAGGSAETFAADLSSPGAIDALARDALAAMGAIDVLVNNAGVAVVAPLGDTSDADWEWIFGVNVFAPIRLTRALLPHMIERGRGQIAITASVAGLIGAPGMLPYSTTKFALVGFAEALRLEVVEHGLDVTLVCPGYVRTNLHRATRYKNERFARFLDDPPAWYGVSKERAAAIIADGIEKKEPLVVFGVEKAGWWLKRLWPAAAFALTRRLSRRVKA